MKGLLFFSRLSMRWIAMFFILLILAAVGGALVAWRYPSVLYGKWMKGEGYNRYYEITNYRKEFLSPVELDEIPEYKEEYPELWKDFPLRSLMLPLPVRHPFFFTVPIIEFDKNVKSVQIGMSFLGSNSRENSRIYALPAGVQKDYATGQELFKLPYVKNRLLKKSPEAVWKDVFSRTLTVDDGPVDEMIYDLYLLHIRSKILPKETIRYGLVPNTSTAIIALESKDKDYAIELVLIPDRGSLYSYVLRTEKNNEESRKLRAKFLTSITFSPSDKAMARILYTEFKQLNFSRQVDQEGMLYLFSAWSQDTSNEDLLREMIFYLERGSKYPKHLESFYKYAMAKYGKTFTSRSVFSGEEDLNISLQRKIELEKLEKRRDLKEKAVEAGPELTPEERMNLYLKKAKEAGPKKKDEMTIH